MQQCQECALGKDCFSETQNSESLRQKVTGHQHFDKGQVIYAEGAQSKFSAVVQSGAVKLMRGEAIVSLALPGDYIGLSSLYADCRIDSAIALERTRICRLDRLDEEPEAVRLLGREMDQQRWHLTLRDRPAGARLACFVQRLSDHQAKRGLSSTFIQLPLNRTEMGNYLGLALETVSRLLTQFANRGILKATGRQVEILDPDALAQLQVERQAEQVG